MSKCQKISMQAYLGVLVLGDASRVSDANLKEEEEASSSSPKQILHPTNTLEHTLLILKYMINEHVFMTLVSLNKNFNPH